MTSSRLTVVMNCTSECAQVSHIHPRRTLWPQRVLFPNLVGAGAFVVVLSVVGRGVVVGRGRKLQPKDWLTEKRSRISSRAPGNILGLGEQEEHLAWQPLTRDCCDHPENPLSPAWALALLTPNVPLRLPINLHVCSRTGSLLLLTSNTVAYLIIVSNACNGVGVPFSSRRTFFLIER